ncbi:hypothetical protein H9P43_002762 [Blastocladiella emersonii ATCC 22665]|nr:hypothetical protein H9P43_002762 [Blastocladiella emersonii ATCC 22665]
MALRAALLSRSRAAKDSTDGSKHAKTNNKTATAAVSDAASSRSADAASAAKDSSDASKDAKTDKKPVAPTRFAKIKWHQPFSPSEPAGKRLDKIVPRTKLDEMIGKYHLRGVLDVVNVLVAGPPTDEETKDDEGGDDDDEDDDDAAEKKDESAVAADKQKADSEDANGKELESKSDDNGKEPPAGEAVLPAAAAAAAAEAGNAESDARDSDRDDAPSDAGISDGDATADTDALGAKPAAKTDKSGSKGADDKDKELEPLERKDIARAGIVATYTVSSAPDGLGFLEGHTFKAKIMLVKVPVETKEKSGDSADGEKSGKQTESLTAGQQPETTPTSSSTTRPRAKAIVTAPAGRSADAAPSAASAPATPSATGAVREPAESKVTASSSNADPAMAAPRKQRSSSADARVLGELDPSLPVPAAAAEPGSRAGEGKSASAPAESEAATAAAPAAASAVADADAGAEDKKKEKPKQKWAPYSIELEYLPGKSNPILFFPGCPLGPLSLDSVAAVLAVREKTQLLIEFKVAPPPKADEDKGKNRETSSAAGSDPKDQGKSDGKRINEKAVGPAAVEPNAPVPTPPSAAGEPSAPAPAPPSVDAAEPNATASASLPSAETKKDGSGGDDAPATFGLDECSGSARFVFKSFKPSLAAAELTLKIAEPDSDDGDGDAKSPSSPTSAPALESTNNEKPESPSLAKPPDSLPPANDESLASSSPAAVAKTSDTEQQSEEKPKTRAVHAATVMLAYAPDEGEDHHWSLSLKAKGSKAVARALKRFGSVNLAVPSSSEVLRLTAASLEIDVVRLASNKQKETAENSAAASPEPNLAKTVDAAASSTAAEKQEESLWKVRGAGRAEVEFDHTIALQDGHPLMSLHGAANATIAVPLDGPTVAEFNGMLELAWADAVAAAAPHVVTSTTSATTTAISSLTETKETSIEKKTTVAADPHQVAVAARACWVPRRMLDVSFGVAGANLYEVSPEWLQFLLPKGKAQLVVRYLSWFKLADPKKPFIIKDATDPISTEGLLKLIASHDDDQEAKKKKKQEQEAGAAAEKQVGEADKQTGSDTDAPSIAPAAEPSSDPSLQKSVARRPRSSSVPPTTSSTSSSSSSPAANETATATLTRPRANAVDRSIDNVTRPRSNAIARRPAAAGQLDAPAKADDDEAEDLPPRSSLLAITYAATSDLATKWDDDTGKKAAFSMLVLRSPTSGNAFVAEISNVDLAVLFGIGDSVQLSLDKVRLTYKQLDEVKDPDAAAAAGPEKEGAADAAANPAESKSKSKSAATTSAAESSASTASAKEQKQTAAGADSAAPAKIPVDVYQAEGELTLLDDIKFSVAATMFRVQGSLDDWALRGQAVVSHAKLVKIAPVLDGLGAKANLRILAMKQPMQKKYLAVLDRSTDDDDADGKKEGESSADEQTDEGGKKEEETAAADAAQQQQLVVAKNDADKTDDTAAAAAAAVVALAKKPSLPPGLEKLFEAGAGEVLIQVSLAESSGALHPRLNGAAIALCVNIQLKSAGPASTPTAVATVAPKRAPTRFGILVNNPGALFNSRALEEQEIALAGSVTTAGNVLILGRALKPKPLTALMLIQAIDSSFTADASVEKLLSELLSVRIYTIGLAFDRGTAAAEDVAKLSKSTFTFVVGCTLSHLEVPVAVMCRVQDGKLGVRVACLPEAAADGSTALTDLVNASLPDVVKDVLDMSPVQLDLVWLDMRYNWIETASSAASADSAKEPLSLPSDPATTTATTAVEKKDAAKKVDIDDDDVTDIILKQLPKWSAKQDPPLVTAEELAKAGKGGGKYTGKGFNVQSSLRLRLEGALWQPLGLDGKSVQGVLQLGEVFAVHGFLPPIDLGEGIKFDANKLTLTRTDIDVAVAMTIRVDGKPWARFAGSLAATLGVSPLVLKADISLEPAAAKAWIALGDLADALRSIYLKGLRLGIELGEAKPSVCFSGGLKIHDPAMSYPVLGAVSLKLPPLKFFYSVAKDVSFTGLLAPFVGENSALLRGLAWVERVLPGIKHLELFFKLDPTAHADVSALPDMSSGSTSSDKGSMRQYLIDNKALEAGSMAIAARCELSFFGMEAKIEGSAIATGLDPKKSAVSLASLPTALVHFDATLSAVKWLGGRLVLAGSSHDLAAAMKCTLELDTAKGLLEFDFAAYIHLDLFVKLAVECRAQLKRHPKTGRTRFTLAATIMLSGAQSAICLSGFFVLGFQSLVPPAVQPMVEEAFPPARLLMVPSEIGLNLRLFGATKNADGTLGSAGLVQCLFQILGDACRGFVDTSKAALKAAKDKLDEKRRNSSIGFFYALGSALLSAVSFVVDLAGKAISFVTSVLAKLTAALIDVHSIHFGGGIQVDAASGDAGAQAYLNVHAVILGTEFKFGLKVSTSGNFLRVLADVLVTLLAADYSEKTDAAASVGQYYPWVDGECSTEPEPPKVQTPPGSRIPMLPNSASAKEQDAAAELRKELQEATDAMASAPPAPPASAPPTTRCPACFQAVVSADPTVDAHSAVCPKALVRCVACDGMVARDAVDSHRASGCKEMAKLDERTRTACPHCATEVLDVNFHLKVDCPAVVKSVEKCAKAGCGALVPAGAMAAHLQHVCAKNIVACTFCRASVVARDREVHETYECARRDIKCTRCAEMVPYVDGDTVEARLLRHSREACWTTCARCTGIYLRQNEEAHRRECKPSVPCNVPGCVRQLFKTRILPNVYSGRCRFCDESLPDDEALVAHLRTCAKALLAPATGSACGALSLHHGPDGTTPKIVLPGGGCCDANGSPALLAVCDPSAVTIAEDATVPCPHGCGALIKSWGAFGAHLDTCANFERRCPTPGCGVLVVGGATSAMFTHLLTACPNATTVTAPCPSPGCDAVLPIKDLNAHLLLECATKVVRCPHCSENVVGGLVRHLNQDCPAYRVACSIEGCPAPEYVKMDEFEHLVAHHILLPPLARPVDPDAIVGHDLDLGSDPARALSSELARLGMDPSHPLYLEAVHRLVAGSLLVREPATVGLPCRNLCGHSFDAPHEEALHVAFKCSLGIVRCPHPNCDIAYAPGTHHIHAVTECIDARVPCPHTAVCPASQSDAVPLLMTTHHAVVECAYATVACWFCPARESRGKLGRHMRLACPERHAPARCDQCAATFPRSHLVKHLVLGCPARRVPCGVGSCTALVASADLVDHWLHACESSLLLGAAKKQAMCTRCSSGAIASYRDWLAHLVGGDCKPANSHACGSQTPNTTTTMKTLSLAGASDAVVVPCPMRCGSPDMPLGRLMEHLVVGTAKHPPCKQLDFDWPCPNARAGCEASVKRWSVQHHLQHECKFHRVSCPMCDAEMESTDLPNHCALECPKRYKLRVLSQGLSEKARKQGDVVVAVNDIAIVDVKNQVDATRSVWRGLHVVAIDIVSGGNGPDAQHQPAVQHWLFDTHERVRDAWQIHHDGAADPTHRTLTSTVWRTSLIDTIKSLVDGKTAPAFRVIVMAVYDEAFWHLYADDRAAIRATMGGPNNEIQKLAHREGYVAVMQLRPAGDGSLARVHLSERRTPEGETVKMEGLLPWAM